MHRQRLDIASLLFLLVASVNNIAYGASLSAQCKVTNLDLPDYRVSSRGDFNSDEFYADKISSLKKEGIYNPALFPILLEYGLAKQNKAEHEAAIKSFEQAVLVMKVNQGLYHTEQLSVIDLLIESQIALQHWAAATDYYDQKYWLIKRNYSAADASTLDVLKQVRQWHRDVYNKETGRSLEQHFTVAEKIYAQGINAIKACGGTERQAYCYWHRACCEDAKPEFGLCPLDIKG